MIHDAPPQSGMRLGYAVASKASAAFEARGIRVGRRFAAMPTWLRVTIGTPEETRAFLEALRAIVPARAAAA